MVSGDFCQHDWPGSGCPECFPEKPKEKIGSEVRGASRDCALSDLDLCVVAAMNDPRQLARVSLRHLTEWRERFNELYYGPRPSWAPPLAPRFVSSAEAAKVSARMCIEWFSDGMAGLHPYLPKVLAAHLPKILARVSSNETHYVVREDELNGLLSVAARSSETPKRKVKPLTWTLVHTHGGPTWYASHHGWTWHIQIGRGRENVEETNRSKAKAQAEFQAQIDAAYEDTTP